jgi:hypothetical protein
MSERLGAPGDFTRALFDTRTSIDQLLEQISTIHSPLNEKSPGDARRLERLAAQLKHLRGGLTLLVERFQERTDPGRWWLKIS